MYKILNTMYESAEFKSQPIGEREKELIELIKDRLGKDVKNYLELESIRYEIFVKHLEDAYKQGVLDGLAYAKDQG